MLDIILNNKIKKPFANKNSKNGKKNNNSINKK